MEIKFLKSKMNIRTCNKKGFTLIETLVAISIILMVAVAPLVILAGDVSAAFSVKDKIIALYLAEDAVDYVKYKIDTNFNTPQYWLTGIPCIGGGACQVDSYNNTIISDTGAVLKFDSNTASPTIGVYGYTSGWQDSKFKRTVTITSVASDPYPPQAPQEIVITATVSWQDHGIPKQTTISEHAFSWGI